MTIIIAILIVGAHVPARPWLALGLLADVLIMFAMTGTTILQIN